MKAGARNTLTGQVTSIKHGDLMGLVKVEIDAASLLSSVMTMESIADLDLAAGDKVKVIVKAVNVLLVKE